MRLPSRKTFLYSVIALLVLLAAAITATIGWRPFIGPRARPLTDRTFASTPERLDRGRYLVRSVTGCLICHSDVDTGVGVPTEAAMNGGGKVWAPEGTPWLVAPNLTADRETGAGGWSDDAIARAVREGIGHDGRALFPIMPYQNYRGMSDEDLASVIVYIRSLPAVRRALPRTEVPFPPGPLINGVPEPLDAPVPQPDLSDPVRRGEYLVRLGSCADCHTPMDAQGARLPGMDFAGGFVLQDSRGQVASANLTPDPSGIPYYTEELFFTAMRTGAVISRKLNDIMPWWALRNQTDEDLRAIFAYLKTLKPVSHRVDNTLPPSECPVCGLTHAGGDRNRRSN
jgi:mono/diheme cytochrome c family protein